MDTQADRCPTCGSGEHQLDSRLDPAELCPDAFHFQLIETLVGRIGEASRDGRTIVDLTLPDDPAPLPVTFGPRLGADLVGAATITIEDDAVVARVAARLAVAQQMLRGELHAHMNVVCSRIETRAEDRTLALYGAELRSLHVSADPSSWLGTWVAPVMAS